jgi:hypothetical protein
MVSWAHLISKRFRDFGLSMPRRRTLSSRPGAFAPRPLSGPDLWAPHPALWIPFSQVEQQRLTRGQFRACVQLLPLGDQ